MRLFPKWIFQIADTVDRFIIMVPNICITTAIIVYIYIIPFQRTWSVENIYLYFVYQERKENGSPGYS